MNDDWRDLPPTPLPGYHMEDGGPWWAPWLVLAVLSALVALVVLL